MSVDHFARKSFSIPKPSILLDGRPHSRIHQNKFWWIAISPIGGRKFPYPWLDRRIHQSRCGLGKLSIGNCGWSKSTPVIQWRRQSGKVSKRSLLKAMTKRSLKLFKGRSEFHAKVRTSFMTVTHGRNKPSNSATNMFIARQIR